jgi:hypothetical protein
MCQNNHVPDPANQAPLPFTCRNAWFETDIGRGHPHGAHAALGSVLPNALSTDPATGNTLWLEYASDHQRRRYNEFFWLIWYDRNGCPLTVTSAVFDRVVVQEMVRRLAAFIVIP